MLLLKSNRNFREVLQCAFTPLVILPASVPGETRDDSKARANDLTVTARIQGLGVTVVEGAKGELFVFASDNESQAVGFARKMLKESKLAEPWFLLLRSATGPLVLETADRSRVDCTLTESGFLMPDGRTVDITAAYVPASRNTAWLAHLGYRVGSTL
jgi:hypothetical protein